MRLELNHTTQASMFFEDVKASMYEKVNQASQKSGLMRLAGPIIAVSSGVLTLADRVASIGETLIKGLVNIFGPPKEANGLKGLEQIFIGVPVEVVRLVFSPIYIVVGGAYTTANMLFEPIEYSRDRRESHIQRLNQLNEAREYVYDIA